jgi:hypothetical protein
LVVLAGNCNVEMAAMMAAAAAAQSLKKQGRWRPSTTETINQSKSNASGSQADERTVSLEPLLVELH